MALADPDLPPGIVLPELRADPPRGFGAERYRLLRVAFDELPRRSRVIVVLRLGFAGHQPLTLRESVSLSITRSGCSSAPGGRIGRRPI